MTDSQFLEYVKDQSIDGLIDILHRYRVVIREKEYDDLTQLGQIRANVMRVERELEGRGFGFDFIEGRAYVLAAREIW